MSISLYYLFEINDHIDRRNIRIGKKVAIVKKEDQRSGKLTVGIIKRILTNKTIHPRGIKVMLKTGEVGRVQKILKN